MLALGLSLLAAGVALGLAFLVVGAVVVVAALSLWIVQLLPGRGHIHEPLTEPVRRPPAIRGVAGRVERLRPGMPGYRLRLPQAVHPISAGVKGGLIGGDAMMARPSSTEYSAATASVTRSTVRRHGAAGSGYR